MAAEEKIVLEEDIQDFNGGAADRSEAENPSNSISLTTEKDDIMTELVRALRIELGDFTAFQGRNIFLYYTGRTGNLVNYTEPPLLLIGLVAVLREIQLRYKEYHADEGDHFPSIVGGVVGISKLLTIISFGVADYFYLRDNPSVIPDKIASIFFIVLFIIEAWMDAWMSAHYPSNDYRAVALFIMFFLKLSLVAAAILQFFEKTELPGLIMAAVLFPLVLANLERFSRYYHQSKIADSSAPSEMPVRGERSVDEESHLLQPAPAINSINNEREQPLVVLSNSRLTFLEELRQKVVLTPAYVMGEDLSRRLTPPR